VEYGVRLAEEAEVDLKRLAKRERTVYNEARSMIGLVAENPRRVGYDLDGEWEGCRALHFARDAYRVIWEVDHVQERIVVLRVGKKRGIGGTSIYSQPRP
jgi:addiction module RelE/StbE family toxin